LFLKALIASLLACIVILAAVLLWPKKNAPELDKAYENYVNGEKATTISARKEFFNRALSQYTSVEKNADLSLSDGKLYYNIANTYFQLEEYPLAAYYYYRAQALVPRNDKIKHNLDLTRAKLGLHPEKKDRSIFKSILFFHDHLPLPERLQLFFLLGILSTLFFSTYIWFPKSWLKKSGIFFTVCTTILLLDLAWTFYLSPLEGVLVHSSMLYKDAGRQYAQVSDQPLLAGTKVEATEILQDGKWLKILTPDETVGYIPQDAILLL